MTTKATHDEISLMDLISVLWKKKLVIALTTVVFTLLAGIYAFTAKEKWTSQAEVISPRLYELGNYFKVRQEYALIVGQEFDATQIANSLYSRFNRLIYSLDERENFFETSPLFKEFSGDKPLDELQKRKLLSSLIVENIVAIKPNAKKDPDAIGNKLTFSAEKPELAQKTLKEFITYISNKAVELDIKELKLFLDRELFKWNAEKSAIIRDADIQRNVQLENLQKALSIAKQANIKEYSSGGYSVSQSNNTSSTEKYSALNEAKISLSDSKIADSTYLFMLGERYLQAQIDVIKNNSVVYPPNLHQIQSRIDSILRLNSELTNDINTQSYSYQNSPNYPINKDKPKRAIILFIGFLVGFILACFGILIQQAFIKRKKDI